MANYTLDTFDFLPDVIIGTNTSTIAAGDRNMFIEPKPGFVVSASDFSQSGTFSDSMSFSNTSEAGQVGNKVKITVTLSPVIIDSSWQPSLGVISGDAKIYEEVEPGFSKDYLDYNFLFEIPSGSGSNTVTLLKVDGSTSISSVSSNINGTTSGVTVKPKQKTLVCFLKVQAQSGNYFNTPIKLKNYKDDDVEVSFSISSTTKDISGKTVEYVYAVNYFSLKNTYIADSIIVGISEAIETVAIPTEVIEVLSVEFGSDLVDINGDTKEFKFNGSIGSDFDFQVVDLGGSSFNADYNVRIISSDSMQSGYSSRIQYKSIATGNIDNDYIEGDSIVLNFEKQSISRQYEVRLDANGETVLNSSIPNTNPRYTLNQYVNPVLRFGATDGSTDYVSKTVTGRPNLTAEDLAHVYDFGDLNFTVTTTVPNTVLSSQPYNDVFEFIGKVDSSSPLRIYFDTSILPSWVTVQNTVGVYEDVVGSNSKLIQVITSEYVEVHPGSPFTLFGEYLPFTVHQGSFGTSVVNQFTGGDVEISNPLAVQSGSDIVYTFNVSIDKFPNQDLDFFTNVNQS